MWGFLFLKPYICRMKNHYQHMTNNGLLDEMHEAIYHKDKPLVESISKELKRRQIEHPNRMSYAEQIHWILKDFNFGRVHNTMKALNWSYCGDSEPPTIEYLRSSARDLLWEVARHKEYMDSPMFYTATGGFRAERWIFEGIPTLRLAFEVCDWDMEQDFVTGDYSNYSEQQYEGPIHD